jgi:hypothetical protein
LFSLSPTGNGNLAEQRHAFFHQRVKPAAEKLFGLIKVDVPVFNSVNVAAESVYISLVYPFKAAFWLTACIGPSAFI